MSDNNKLKPIGIQPTWVWLWQTVDRTTLCERLYGLVGAINRYKDAGLEVDPEWVNEQSALEKAINTPLP